MVEVNEAEVRDMARQLVADVPPDQVDQFEFRGRSFQILHQLGTLPVPCIFAES